jgi:hypothetical protein
MKRQGYEFPVTDQDPFDLRTAGLLALACHAWKHRWDLMRLPDGLRLLLSGIQKL